MDDIDGVGEQEIGALLRDAVATYEPPPDFRDRVDDLARTQSNRVQVSRSLAMVAAVVVLLMGVAAFAAGRGSDQQHMTLGMPPGSGTSVPAAPGSDVEPIPGTTPGTIIEVKPWVPGDRVDCPNRVWVDPASDQWPQGTVPLPDGAPPDGAPPDGAMVTLYVCFEEWVIVGVDGGAPPENVRFVVYHYVDGSWVVVSEGFTEVCGELPPDAAAGLCLPGLDGGWVFSPTAIEGVACVHIAPPGTTEGQGGGFVELTCMPPMPIDALPSTPEAAPPG